MSMTTTIVAFLALILPLYSLNYLHKAPQKTVDVYHKFGLVPANPEHQYSLLKNLQSYSQNLTWEDFNVSWPTPANNLKNHSFFTYIGELADFDYFIPAMKCNLTSNLTESIKKFSQICGQITQKDYKAAFGSENIYVCAIPKNYVGIEIRFVADLFNFGGHIGGKWYQFGGLFYYKDISSVQYLASQYVQYLRLLSLFTRLNTFDINYNLNIIPQFIQGTLARLYNDKNINLRNKSTLNKKYPLTDQGFIKIIPPGNNLIIGNIYNGTTYVKQSCDNFEGNASELVKKLLQG